ncbi:MAG: hypothetical protein EAX86_00955 [Candidatus Heimdallarchaeota archaeon]|nr:hypothetical protein [Candidatus Heimdallarchaeota archaeon]
MPELMETSPRFFFLLSGENPELAVYELNCVISIFIDNKHLKISTNQDNRILNITFSTEFDRNAILDNIRLITHRVTMVHFCCETFFTQEFTNTPLDFNELKEIIPKEVFLNLDCKKSFSFITKRIGEPVGIFKHSWVSPKFSEHLGHLVQQNFPSKKVKLDSPEEQYIVLLNQNGIWCGKKIFHSLRDKVRQRTSRKRPFFHPSSMNPILQRTLINLSAIKEKEWLLDPFCGSGGALLESARLGIKSIGIEIDKRIIWGSRQNLQCETESFPRTHLIFGDAKSLPIKTESICGVVTDPPYGTASSTQGFDLSDLLIAFFQEISQILGSGKRIVIAVPAEINIENLAANILNASFRVFYQYVHRSLTRKIIVFILN